MSRPSKELAQSNCVGTHSYRHQENTIKFFTEALKQQLPPLYSQQQEADPQVICKFFHPMSSMTWYAIEGSPVDEDGYFDTDKEKVDYLFFGWVYSDFPELGYFSLNEMQQLKVAGLGMERDLHFTPKK